MKFTRLINYGPRTLGGRNIEFFSVNVDGTKSYHWALTVIGQQFTIRCSVKFVTVLYWAQEVSVCNSKPISAVSCLDQDILVRKITKYLENTPSPFAEQLLAITDL